MLRCAGPFNDDNPLIMPEGVFGSVRLESTKRFAVLSYIEDTRIDPSYCTKGQYDEKLEQLAKQRLQKYGLCVFNGIVEQQTQITAKRGLHSLVERLLKHYDFVADEFSGVDMEDLCVVRMPRIGRGKHNIHFDPFLPGTHNTLADLAEESSFSKILSSYMRKECSIREYGISMTRPYYSSSSTDPSTAPGEGMEWHSDGARGEATVLMALDDINEMMGTLFIMPGSHMKYVDGIGHDEVCEDHFIYLHCEGWIFIVCSVFRQDHVRAQSKILDEGKASYNYRAGCPIIIDARTLHSVSPNMSDRWRVIIWYIFDSY